MVSSLGLSIVVVDFTLESFLFRWGVGPVMCLFLVKGTKASTAFGSCQGGSGNQLLVSVGSVLGGSTWEEAPFIN